MKINLAMLARKCMMLSAIVILGGCGAFPPNKVAVTEAHPVVHALSLDEIVTLSRQGVGADALVSRIRSTKAIYHLSAGEVISLRERGVPLAVIDHLLAPERQVAPGGSKSVEKTSDRLAGKNRQAYVASLYHGF